jgi:hypothetical protein
MLFRLFPATSHYDWCIVFTFNFYAMRTKKNTKPTFLEIINYWHDQKKKNLGRFNMEHYLRVCQAKAYNVRFDENNKMIRI